MKKLNFFSKIISIFNKTPETTIKQAETPTEYLKGIANHFLHDKCCFCGKIHNEIEEINNSDGRKKRLPCQIKSLCNDGFKTYLN
jgi:hypothetical protein